MTETIEPMTTTGLASLGWDEDWAAAFADAGHVAAGHRPARVVAVHRETSIVRDGDGRSDGVGLGRLPLRGPGRVRLPDRRRLGRDRRERRHRRRPAAPDASFKRMAADASRLLSGLDDEQVMASNVDVALLVAGLDNDFNLRRIERYLAVAWSSEVLPVVVLNKADLADDVDGRVVAVEAIAPGVAIVAGLGLDRPRAGRAARAPAARGDGRDPRLVRGRQVHARQRPARRGPPGDRGRPRIATRAAGTRPPTASCSNCPAGRSSSTRPGIRALEVLGAEAGLEAAFDEVAEIAATCRFSDCGHDSEPGCAVRLAIADGRIDEERLESFRKLQREQARVARQEDPRARAESRRTWKLIHKSVNEHMKRKYGDDR